MIDALPSPLVPAEVDLRDFQYMELDVRVLRDSRFAAQVSGDGFRAGVLLWCAAWHQVPAGSVPDDDIELANLAGYGRFVKEWRKVRDQALMQFTKCSDGRLYHATVCEKALQAWDSKLHHHYDRARDRLRKANKARIADGQKPLPELTFERWNELRLAASVPMEKAECSAGTPSNPPDAAAGIPPENALRGNGEGTERERNGEGDSLSAPSGAGAGAPPPASAPPPPATVSGDPPAPVDTIFALGLPMLLQAQVPERNARTFLGHLRRLAKSKGGDRAVVDALNRCVQQQAVDPVTFLQACFTSKPNGAEQPGLDELTAAVQRRLGISPKPSEVIDG
jgi:hypothetical protein